MEAQRNAAGKTSCFARSGTQVGGTASIEVPMISMCNSIYSKYPIPSLETRPVRQRGALGAFAGGFERGRPEGNPEGRGLRPGNTQATFWWASTSRLPASALIFPSPTDLQIVGRGMPSIFHAPLAHSTSIDWASGLTWTRAPLPILSCSADARLRSAGVAQPISRDTIAPNAKIASGISSTIAAGATRL